MTSQHLQINTEGPVARITLARPEIRNAFSDEVIAELSAAFTAVAARSDLRAVVLAAQGPAFCAGADLNWMRRMADYSPAENRRDAAGLAELLRLIANCPQPTIARVQGDAYAGGMGLVAACDIAVAAHGAGFCLSEVRLGLIPAIISPYVLRAIGERAARRYFLTAERFDSAEALRLGLVHAVVDADALDAKVQELLAALCKAGPQALRACKRLLHETAGRAIDSELIASTVQAIAHIRASGEGKEGVAAFLAKRRPQWLGA